MKKKSIILDIKVVGKSKNGGLLKEYLLQCQNLKCLKNFWVDRRKKGRIYCSDDCIPKTLEETQKKEISNTLKKYFSENDVWSKGLTKNDHPAIALLASKLKGRENPTAKENIKAAHKFNKGKKRIFSKDWKENMSKAHFGKTLGPQSIDHKNKIQQGRIKYYKEHSEEAKGWKMVSKAETKFFNEIEKKYKVSIFRQFVLEGKIFDGLYKNILIESDGKYFHQNKENDELKNKIAIDNGYEIFRFEINDVREVERKIKFYENVLNLLFKKS